MGNRIHTVKSGLGESNPLNSGVSGLSGGHDAQIDAQEMDSDRQILTQIAQVWPTLEEWRKRAIMVIAQAVSVSKPQHGQVVFKLRSR